MIKKDNQTIGTIYKGSTQIGKIYKGNILVYQSIKDMIARGVNFVLIHKAKANSLEYLKAFGKCEQSSTPTPDNPIPIICNNGELKVRNKSGLPLGYQAIEYIQFTGTQYLRTPITIQTVRRVKGDVSFENVSASDLNYVAGVRNTSEVALGFGVLASGRGGFTCYPFEWKSNSIAYSATTNEKISFDTTINETDTRFIINGVTRYSGSTVSPNFTGGRSITIGCLKAPAPQSQTPQYYLNGKIYNIEMYDGSNNLIFKGIPAKNDSNIIGLYDTVSNSFLTNSGTGTFIAGADVDDMEVYADGTEEKIEIDTTGDIATAENLLSVGDYEDIQEVISGNVTRNVGIKVLDGTENWAKADGGGGKFVFYIGKNGDAKSNSGSICMSNIALGVGNFWDNIGVTVRSNNNFGFVNIPNMTINSSVNDWATYLAQQYANGTPVIIVYPLATSTTETVTTQSMNIQEGTNTIEVTDASLNDLELEIKYKGK